MPTLTVVWLIVAAVVLVIVVALIRFMLRTGRTPMETFLLALNVVLNRLLWRTKVDRPMPELPGQGAIVIANHRSGFDPMFLQFATTRIVRWMVAKEYVTSIWLRWFFRAMGTIPAGRGGVDTAAIKQAIRYAQEGHYVGMMPEGRINTTDKLLISGRPGVAKIALKARVKVIPCYIQGAPYNGTVIGPLFMRARVKVKFGDPIDLSEFYGRERDGEVLATLTKRFLKEIARLAGDETFQPEIAGGRDWKDLDVEQPA